MRSQVEQEPHALGASPISKKRTMLMLKLRPSAAKAPPIWHQSQKDDSRARPFSRACDAPLSPEESYRSEEEWQKQTAGLRQRAEAPPCKLALVLCKCKGDHVG